MSRALVPLKPPEKHELRDADFAVSIKVRNGRFLAALRRAGYASVNAFCKKNGLNQGLVNQYVTLTRSPVKFYSGAVSKTAQTVLDILNAQLEDLFPPRFLATCLARSAHAEDLPMTEGQIGMLLREPPHTPEDVLALDEAAAKVSNTLILLPPREERLLRLRYGMGPREEKTLRQTGEQLDITAERVRGIENSAIRKMGHPSRKYKLLEPAHTLGIGEFYMDVPLRQVTASEAGIRLTKEARKNAHISIRKPPEIDYAWRMKVPRAWPEETPKPPPVPEYVRLLRTPEPERTDQIKMAISYHLEQEIIRRGGSEIKPYPGFADTFAAMTTKEQELYKYNWFLREWKALWENFPPEPVL